MMPRIEGERDEEAIGWLIRLRDDAAASDWIAFTAWLEANPANARAYDHVAGADRLSDGIEWSSAGSSLPVAANDDLPIAGRPRRGAFAGAALLAAAAVAGLFIWSPHTAPITFATGAGEHRVVTIADGTRVALNGATTVTLDPHDPRRATLASGEATFTVRHDPARPFELVVGGTMVRDLGTVFDVTHDGDGIRVAVASGRVAVDSGGGDVALGAGQQLVMRADLTERSAIAPADVGGWRTGRLVFRQAPLTRVVGEISRTTGIPIELDSVLASQSFTGLVIVDHDHDALFRRLGPLLGGRIVREGRGWRLEPPAR